MNTSISHERKAPFSKENIDHLLDVVKRARQSGEVLVQVGSDGKVVVRSVSDAVSLALKEKKEYWRNAILAAIMAMGVGVAIGMLIGKYFPSQNLRMPDTEVLGLSAPVTPAESRLLGALTEQLINEETEGNQERPETIESLLDAGKIDEAHVRWTNLLDALPDSMPVILAGVYSREEVALQFYKRVTPEFDALLSKLEVEGATQTLLLVLQSSEYSFEDTRKKLAERLDIPLPKWNNALRFKKK